MNNTLLSTEDMLRERFNSVDISSLDSDFAFGKNEGKKFIFFILQIFQFAYISGIIDESERNAKGAFLFNSIAELTMENPIATSNYLYVISSYLKTMNNWEAWERVEKINSKKDAELFIREVATWFYKKLEYFQAKLDKANALITGIPEAQISLVFLSKQINELHQLFGRDSSVSLKNYHNATINLEYDLLYEVSGNNYIERFEAIVNAFLIEMSILKKMNAKHLFKLKSAEIRKEANLSKENARKESLQRIKDLNAKLKRLDFQLEKELEKAEKNNSLIDQHLDDLEDEFRDLNPDLDENEFEIAFDEYLAEISETDEILEIAYKDTDEIFAIYQKKKNKLLEIIDKCEKELTQIEDNILILDDSHSLQTLIKEFYLFSLVKEGKTNYPKTANEKAVIMNNLDIFQAINIFLSNSGIDFSEQEKKYLLKK